MKILTITFYKDFARYFVYIESEIKKHFEEVEFINHVLYPCAKKYFEQNNLHSEIIPFGINYKYTHKIEELESYRGYNLKSLISYTYKSLNDNNLNIYHNLKKRAISYIDHYEKLFYENKIEYVICSGDTRLPIEVCISVAKKYNVKIWYFEQGPFGTTIFDDIGVNGNASFSLKAGEKDAENVIDIEKFISDQKLISGDKYWIGQKKSLGDKISDWKTLILMHPPYILRSILPLELKSGDYFLEFIVKHFKRKLNFIKAPQKILKTNTDTMFVAVLLQVPFDAQMIQHSPHYETISEMVTDVIKNVPYGYNVLIREHPLHIGLYEKELYNLTGDSGKAFIDNETSLNEIIDKSAYIIVNNSTGGLDAMRRNKTVVVLGNAYYANDDVVYRLTDKCDLKRILFLASKTPIDPLKIQEHLSWLIGKCLIPGHYHDKNLVNAKLVLDKIFKKNLK